MTVYTPETISRGELLDRDPEFTVFLGGSIEMGKAEDWQKEVICLLSGEKIDILNPRRDDWDSSWVQSKDNWQFRNQVEWEIDAQEQANVLIYYFSPGTQSPITLLELGMFAHRGRDVIVICPEGFWRKGNVDIVAARNQCQRVDTLDEAVQCVRELKREYYNHEEIPF